MPPTVQRTIGEELGSAQLFLQGYQTNAQIQEKIADNIEEDDRYYELLSSSKDLMKLCVFDWIIGNCDRRSENSMVEIDPETGFPKEYDGEIRLAAIDNGLALHTKFYNWADVSGPYQLLTTDPSTRQSVFKEIPEWLMTQLKEGYENRGRLIEQMHSFDDISEYEIECMLGRWKALIDHGVFLSGHNYADLVKGKHK